MSTSKSRLESVKDYIKSSGLENEFLKSLGIETLDELHPDNFKDPYPARPLVTSQPTISAAPTPAIQQDKSVADARPVSHLSVASDVLAPFAGIHVLYAPRKKLSFYFPSCLMMDYIVHLVNFNLVDNFYFKRHAPDYHPYILRLYYGVIFWIQCLRAGYDVRSLTNDQHQFLVQFLDSHPLESLPIVGPLIPLFKTLCSSQPEIPTYGKVYPRIPPEAGPHARRNFIGENPIHFFLPNVPGIFALLEHLNGLINAPNQPVFPGKGKHIPVTENAAQPVVFGHHTFPVPAERSNLERWALCSPGLQYLCEADSRLNENFAERYGDFDFPATAGNDCLYDIGSFLSLDTSMSWFNQVKGVAAAAAAYFEGSGTLADCPNHGITANQFIVELQNPAVAVTAPTHSADRRALFPFRFRLATTARSPPQLSEAMSSMAQTHIRMFHTHPFLNNFGQTQGHGDFWNIRPIEHSNVDDSTYLSLSNSVKRMMKSKN